MTVLGNLSDKSAATVVKNSLLADSCLSLPAHTVRAVCGTACESTLLIFSLSQYILHDLITDFGSTLISVYTNDI